MPNKKDAVNPPETDETEEETTVEEVAENFSLSSVLPLVLAKAGVPQVIDDILWDFLGGERRFDVRRVFKRQLQRRITTQEGRTGGELLARALVKQIDAHYEAEVQGLTMDERHAVISALVEQTARQLVLAADTLLQYPPIARDVNECKAKHDVRGLAAARQTRTLMVEDIKRAIVNAVRATVGDETIG